MSSFRSKNTKFSLSRSLPGVYKGSCENQTCICNNTGQIFIVLFLFGGLNCFIVFFFHLALRQTQETWFPANSFDCLHMLQHPDSETDMKKP